MKKINSIFKFFVLLSALLAGVDTVWAGQAAVYAYADSKEGGYVCVQTSNTAPPTYTLSEDSKSQGGFGGSGNKYFYLFCEPKDGYVFKGWVKSNSRISSTTSNSGTFLQSKGWQVTQSANGIGEQAVYCVAIFARMILSDGSTERNLTTTLNSPVTNEVIVSHVHASTVSAEFSDESKNLGYSVKVKQGSLNSSTNNDVTTTFVVTYNPQTAGTHNGTLTIKSSNNLKDIVINYTGTSNKYPQSISWQDGEDYNISLEAADDRDITDYVVYSGRPDRTPRFVSGDESIVTIVTKDGRVYVHPVAVDDVTITAYMEGDTEYLEASASKTFTVKERATPVYTVNSEYNLLVGESFMVTSTSPEPITCERVSGSTDGVYIFNNGTVTALKAGSVVLNFKQANSNAWYSGETGNVTVNISRHTTNLSVNTSAQTLRVGENYNPAFSTNNSEVTPVFSSSNSSVAIYGDGVIKAKAAGTATLTFSQPETDKWTADSKTIDVTVERHPNPITVKFDGETQTDNRKVLHFDGTTPVTFEAANSSDFVVSASSDETIATYENGTIRASHKPGTATFTVTQAETATHKAGSATFIVEVAYADDDCYVLDELPWGTTLPKGGSGTTYSLSGRGATLSIEASRNTNYTTTLAIYGIDANNVEKTTPLLSQSLGSSNATYSISVPRDIVKIRLQATGGSVFYKNLRVTRLKTIEVTPMTFSENAFVGESKKQNLPIYYSTANGDDIKIVCDNPKFSFAQNTISTDACSDATVNVEVAYTSATARTDVAHLIIYNSTNRIETSITATTVKKNQTLTWAADISPMTVGMTHINPASAALSLNYEVVAGGESVLEILNGNEIHAIAPGTATVRAYNAGDATWNQVEGEYTFTVTELKVQRIEWMQSFTNLKTGGENIDLDAKVYVISDNGENESAELVDRPITYTSDNVSVVRVVNGNQLEIVSAGEANLTAKQPGDAKYLAAEAVRPVQVREPSAGCEMFVLEKAYGTIDGVGEKVIELTGEPETISFGAWRTAQSNRTGGELYLSEYVDGQWSSALWSDETKENFTTSYGPITLSHNAKKIKFYTLSGATGKHSFSGVNVKMARYLEFVDSPDATAVNVYFQSSETQIGQTYTKTVNIRYSDIFDRLTVSHENDKFTITPTTIGSACGDHGTATISIQFYAESEGTKEDVITITDGRKTLTIRVSATTQKNDQTITFTPASPILTTDNVTLSATATSGLEVSFTQLSGLDYATVNAAGEVTILQGGGSIVVRATQEGNKLYNAAPSVDKTININKVTPTIATAPTVADVTLPATLANATINGASAVVVDDKGTSVDGSFTWADEATAVAAGANSYSAIFTPTNTNFYTTATCDLSVTASKLSQTIVWSLEAGSSHHYFQPVALDAEATSGLSITYTSSNESVAKIATGTVQFIAPGVVTLTASQAGNETYEAAESVSRTISIVKATPEITTIPEFVTIYKGNQLIKSPILGGVATVDGNPVEGTFSWKEDATPMEEGYFDYPAIFTPTNITFFNPTECNVQVRVTPYDRVFTDVTGNHRWNDKRNWRNGFVPDAVDEVTIDGTLIIDLSVTVGELTIEEGASVLVVESGSLTVDHSGTSSNGRYGDLYVQDAASVTFNGDFYLNDFYLSSSLDSYNGLSTSGQIFNENHMHIGGDVYFDLQIDASGTCSPGWYDFTVPFPVDALNGVYRIEENGEVRKVTNEVNYAIMSYSEAVRAEGKYGWKKFRGIMQPGVCYSMTIDDVYPVYRFKKTATGALNTESTMAMTYTSGTGSSENWGWNCLGNGTLRHADLSADGINKVQVYNHASNSYSVVSMNECSFVVGAAFFVQAVSNQSLMTLNSASHSVLRAPAAAPAYSDEHCLVLTRENSASVLDRLYLSATEESKSSYLPGHDLAKFETSASTAQMWCAAFGAKLCDAELALTNNKVDFPLTISTPSAATYTLSLSKTVQSETLYLVRDGAIVWNLSLSDYTFDLPKGTDTSYSIRLVRDAYSTPTGINYLEQHSANKCLIDGVLYILRDGRMFDVEGRLVK